MNSLDLAAALDTTPQALYRWNQAGYLHPEVTNTSDGRVIRYGSGDVQTATRMARLVNVGLPPRLAYRVVVGDRALTEALLAEIDGTTREPILEPMVRDEPAAERALVDAMDIAVAVRDVDPRDLFAELEELVGQPRRLVAAVVALAAMVPVETPVSELLAWTETFVEGAA